MTRYFDACLFAAMVKARRDERGLREIASEIGAISISTLSRIENERVPDIETFFLLCDWLNLPPRLFLKDTQDDEQSGTTVERIAALLRTDDILEPWRAEALIAMLEAAYTAITPYRNARFCIVFDGID
jgi:transcriptional regulator with XRE-family HTH domain